MIQNSHSGELIGIFGLNEAGGSIYLRGCCGSSLSFYAANIYQRTHKNILVVRNAKEEAAYTLNDLQNLLPSTPVLFFPESYKKPYQIEKTSNANVQERTAVLNFLSNDVHSGIVVTYPQALAELVLYKKNLRKNTLQLKRGEKLSIEFMEEFLRGYGFNKLDFVFEPGQYAVRGGIVDVYSYANDLPYRIELFGNSVESLKSFDPVTQLSSKSFEFITLVPDINSSIQTTEKTLLFSYFNENNTWLFIEDINYCADLLKKIYRQAEETFANLTSEIKQTDPSNLYAKHSNFLNEILKFQIAEFGVNNYFKFPVVEDNQSPQPRFSKNFELLITHLKENKAKGYKNFFVTDNRKQADRLITIFNDLLAKDHRTYESLIDWLPFNLQAGFIDHQRKIAVFTDHEIFERYYRYKLKDVHHKTNETLSLKEIMALNPGDYVTHIDHGIGRFGGLEKITIAGKQQEVVRLVYKDNDILYVSIHNLHRISKYSGKEGNIPRIDKLGSTHWQTLKLKTKKKVKEIAFDLIKLYASRKAAKGHAFQKDNYLQHELEASFIYEDTPDQIKVTADVKKDMEKDRPMDRLICGDVGFGKTEIAIRAAFKAVCDSKQVAVLVPTTILAYQHYKTFKERLRGLPCNVEYVNRFRTNKEQKQVFQKVKDGGVDILIGTHKIISKEVSFKDLGLLIIDEEQKFGVGVKEKLRSLKTSVDTLTLTATPIPRTLQFSLMGARDLSVIATPPPNRFPVQTEIHTFNEELIRDAVSYELRRGGQVFFVHNRVADISEIAGIIKRLVPDARVAIGHGQLEGDKMEQIMLGFIEGEYDVLVSTTIIESGIDITNANTIIINQAQNFGLSDLHQMRGRVGRSNKKAFCYLLAPPMSVLTSEAQKRLRALVEFNDLGSGFQIAMRDLDIRGAGNLLGAEQSGFINDMGFDTYMKILNEAVEEIKQEKWYKESIEEQNFTDTSVFSRQFVKEVTIDSDLQLLIPDSYVASLSERLNLYRELDNITTDQGLIDFENNLRDRFGPVPAEALELINLIKMRKIALALGFEKIVLKSGFMRIYFIANPDSDYYNSPMFKAVLQFVQKYPSLCNLKEQNNRLSLLIQNVNSIHRALDIVTAMHLLMKETENLTINHEA